MHAEDIVKRDPKELSGFKEKFCLNTVIWYFLNQLERSYLLTQDNYKALQYSNGVRVSLFKDEYRISQNNSVLVENGDMMIPANWISDDAMIAYSKKGYQNRTWQLPERFMKIRQVKIYRVSQDGNIFVKAQKVKSGRIILSMQEDEMFYIK